MKATPAVQVEGRFAQIPEALLYDVAITADAVRVYGVLHRYGTQPGNCYPAHATIASHVGKSERSIPGWIKILEDAGWVTRVQRWRRGDEITAEPDERTGWEPTSNGYYLHAVKRAGERALHVPQRGPLHAGERTPSTLGNAPKDSQLNESQFEGENTGSLTLVAQPPAVVVDDGFHHFWGLYPTRNGRKVGKAEAQRVWTKLTPEQREDAMVCLANYAYECAEGTYAKDAHRWLRPSVWCDWRDPAEVERRLSRRQQRKKENADQFVGNEQPTGAVGERFFGSHGTRGLGA